MYTGFTVPSEAEQWLHSFENDIKQECGSDVFHAIQEELKERRYEEGSYGD